MSYSYQVYRDLLFAGTNITVPSGIPSTILKELACIAKQKDVLLTIKVGSQPSDILRELALIGGKNIKLEFE